MMKAITIKTELQYEDNGYKSHLVNTDEKRFNQVLINLINNALKYTSRNGVVQIKVDKVFKHGRETHLRIQVIDSGYGIEESDRDKLFKMFGMIDKTKSVNTNGIGLGLSISNLIVKKFNGAIDFSSEVGVGSNFFFTF